MNKFALRSNQKEMLDGDNISFNDIKRNMVELDKINTLLGGHKITIAGLKQLIKKSPFLIYNNTIHICEIGCGGGDNLRVLKHWCANNNISAVFSGIDINSNSISFAKSLPQNDGIVFIASDYSKVVFEQKPDIIFSSLFCHHLNENEIVQMLEWSSVNAKIGFFINDLQRHPFAYYAIKILTAFFSKSTLVKNDAPISVLRGFQKKELVVLLNSSKYCNFTIQWKWAFRWLVCAYNQNK